MERKPKSRKAKERRKLHHGLDRHRLEWHASDLEQAFADLWEKENEEHPGRNYGFGTLQDLMVRSTGGSMYNMRVPFWITQRERVIAATVIQWLGTNCGFCFLCNALGKCRLMVEDMKPLDPGKPRENVRFMRFDGVRDSRAQGPSDGCKI